jgi:hypothetical protein
LPDSAKLRAEWDCPVGCKKVRWRLIGGIDGGPQARFEALARRAAFEIANPDYPDLLVAWLEALRENGWSEPGSYYDEQDADGSEGLPHTVGTIALACEASANFCKTLESHAIQAEFEEKQRNHPKNWSPLRQRFEAFKTIKELRAGPHEHIPESLVKEVLALQYGIKPEEVTRRQIQFEVSRLLPDYPAIRVVPSEPEPAQTEPPQPEAQNFGCGESGALASTGRRKVDVPVMSLTTIPEYRLTFQTGVHLPPLHPVLTSVRRRFLEDTGDILMSSKIHVLEQIKANFEAASDPADLDDKNSRKQNAHVVFRTGLADCLESFVSSARDYYNKLVKIAHANPDWNIDDSPVWARYRIQELLDEKLSKPGVSGLPALDRWFRWTCDGSPDFDRGEHGFSEPWCAPAWCVPHFWVSAWTRRDNPERLTAERTQKVINSARLHFNERLRNELVVAEDEARIELEVKKTQSIAPHPRHQDISASRAPSQAGLLPVHSSASLSQFEVTVGKLMVEARRGCPTKYLPQTEILKIAALLDDNNVPVRGNLERGAARTMAEYNQHYPRAPIKSWRNALGHPQFRRAVRKRFSRAEDKYTKASVAGPSAGTPRTTI